MNYCKLGLFLAHGFDVHDGVDARPVPEVAAGRALRRGHRELLLDAVVVGRGVAQLAPVVQVPGEDLLFLIGQFENKTRFFFATEACRSCDSCRSYLANCCTVLI